YRAKHLRQCAWAFFSGCDCGHGDARWPGKLLDILHEQGHELGAQCTAPEKDGQLLEIGQYLAQQLNSLPEKLDSYVGVASRVAARASETLYKSLAHSVAAIPHDDRNCPRRALCCDDPLRSPNQDDIDIATNK